MYPELTKTYFAENSLVKQYIESYNEFVDHGMQQVIDAQKVIEPQIEGVVLKLGKIRAERPMITEADGSRRPLYPMEARLRDLSYTAPLFLEVTLVVNGVEKKTEDVFIGELPVMIKSKLCYLNNKSRQELIELGEDPMDGGAYFIINGTEKALVTMEDLAPNRLLISRDKETGETSAKIFSTRLGFRGKCTVERNAEGRIGVTMPSYSKALELVLVLKALGLDDEEKILGAFSDAPEIRNDILLNLELVEAKKKRDALETIGKRAAPSQPVDYQVKRAELLLDHYLFPHIGVDAESRLAKAYFLCRMTERAILVAYKKRRVEDKDHYANKRLKIAGKLMEDLFKYAFQFFVKDVCYQIERANVRGRKISMAVVMRPDALTDRIKYSMATGNWVGGHTGVCQPLDRYNFISSTSFLRRVTSPLAKKHPHHKARDLHGTHFGRLDPNETPEGPNCVAPDTQIMLDNRTAMTIADYERFAGREKILSCNWNSKNFVASDIGRYITQKPANTTAFKVVTESGRQVIATADHPFYSALQGKTALSHLKIGEKVAVLPEIPLAFEEPRDDVIVSEEDIRRACPPKTDCEYVVKTLKTTGLLPLHANDRRLPALARLVGHMFGDGTLSYSLRRHKSVVTIAFTADAEGLTEIAEDVKTLGFNISALTSQTTTSRFSRGQAIRGTLRMNCYSKPLWTLLAALGAPVGNKGNRSTSLPEWIEKGSNLVAREFLGAFFGAEMTTPRVSRTNDKTFLTPMFSLSKRTQNVAEGMEFVESVRKLLARFGVETKRVVTVFGTKRKDGSENKKIKVLLKSTYDNLIALYGTIGFAYCPRKQALARLATAYLLAKKNEVMAREKAMQLVLAAQGKSFSAIAEETGVAIHDVAKWLKAKKKGIKVQPPESFPRFTHWLAEHVASDKGLVWEKIKSIEPVECTDVRDVTTVQDFHNFFANGFLTGNCGLIRNLALLCEVTNEGNEKEVEGMLRKLGVSIKA